MKFFVCGLILVGLLAIVAHAEPEPAPEPEPAKGRRGSFFNQAASPKFRSVQADDVQLRQANANVNANAADEMDDAEDEDGNDEKVAVNADGSSGRLFMKKFLLFKNMFGSSSSTQPVIPIIITGAGSTGTTGTTGVSPTTTITSTGTIPTATGTITTTPTTASRADDSSDDEEDAEALAMEEQALQAALAAGAQEYVVTDEEIKGTSDGKASRQPASINLKRKGAKKGQTISVRIPPKYRRYFQNGQRVMLNTSNRPAKRRVVKKRVHKNRRRRVNKNRRIRPRMATA